MKQLIIGLAVMGVCVTGEFAFATGPPANPNENYNMNANDNYNMNSNTNTYKPTNNVSNTNKASNDQTQKQSQGQGQDQGQYQSADYSGQNSQSVNLNTPHQAPAFGVYASGPCSGISFAVSTVLGGGGIGFTDGECSKREAVRTFWMLNEREIALGIAKNLDAYKAVYPDKTEAAAVTISSANHKFGQ
jgi:hypothetical protein